MTKGHRHTTSAAGVLARQLRQCLEPIDIAAPFLADWPALDATPPAVSARRLPVVDHMPVLTGLAPPALVPLLQTVAGAAEALDWRQTYTAADFGPAFLDAYGWTELIGLRGPIRSAEVACGLLMLGPGTDYPAHAHEAEELYLPLAGTALWQRGDEAFVRRAAGEPILHPSWMPHAMRTEAEPLLALYVWRGGDLTAKSRILGR